MMPNTYEALTPTEREELALCGISSEEQMVHCSADKIIKDLQQAKLFFPEKTFILTPERIREIFPDEAPVQDSDDSDLPGWRSARPVTSFRNCSHTTQNGASKRHRAQILHSPVRCTHRAKALFAALATLGLSIPPIGAGVFACMLITGDLPDNPNLPLIPLAALVLVLPVIIYLIMARCATCPVCHMRIFRFTQYPRNRAAHHLPILGYNLTTALHLLIFWNYNCPGCGTPVKLLGTKGHRTHS